MKGLIHFNNLYNDFKPKSILEIDSFWRFDLESKNIGKLVLSPYNEFMYHTMMGYMSKSLFDLFDTPVSDEKALESSNIWFGIRLIDQVVDLNLVDNPKQFLDDSFSVFEGDLPCKNYSGIEKKVLNSLEKLADRYDISQYQDTMLNLKDSVVNERTSQTFDDYLQASINIGTYSAHLLYDVVKSYDKQNIPERNFFAKTGVYGNIIDCIRDFKEDKKSLKIIFTKQDKQKLYSLTRKYTQSLFLDPIAKAPELISLLTIPLINRMKVDKDDIYS